MYSLMQSGPHTPQHQPHQWLYQNANPSFYSDLGTGTKASQTHSAGFQNVFPSSYAASGALALGSSFNVTNNLPSTSMTSQTTALSGKQKQAPNSPTTASKRRNVTLPTSKAENNPTVPQQAVPGVGPQTSNTDTASEQHPSLTRTTRRAQHLNSQ
ncbi:hypothetical protein B0H34DRAFT_797941 [Crassisporium funariophilum]|nr:hypothetical protein B0H34DRAFT_797941 [Crassisporium funariophilum]